MKLSIVIPVFNEEKTVGEIIKRIQAIRIHGVEKEIIIVDDGSKDRTLSVISNLKLKITNLRTIRHKQNMGKGAAVKTGIKNARGDYIVIQDADLEYNPNDIKRLIVPVKSNKAQVVYGTRLRRLPNLLRDERTPQFLLHYFGNRFLSFLTSMLYGQWITDMETCYKLFSAKSIKNMQLNAKGFEFEPEITAKLLKKGYKIIEIPIATNPRDYSEGKKLNTFKDGTIALWTLFKYRFFD